MKWLVFVIALASLASLASGCRAVGDTLVCLTYNDEWKQKACDDQAAENRAYDRKHGAEDDRRAVREHDEDLQARQEYRAAIEPCAAGYARACFITALYEDRHGAPSATVEPRYRLACVGGVGRACFMAGAHARTRAGADPTSGRQLALASFTQGCELGDGDSCRAGVELDPMRIDLVETACAAHYPWACTMLGR